MAGLPKAWTTVIKPVPKAAVPTTASVKAQWGVPGAGYAPGYFGPPTSKASQKLFGGSHGFFEDPDVIGQSVGDYRPIPIVDPDLNPGGTESGDEKVQAKANILNDPEYVQGLQNLRDALFSGQTKTRNALRQAIIGAGFDPRSGAASLGFDTGGWSSYIDPADYAAALANPNSTRAQLESQRQSSMRDLTANLAARNMLRSGASATGTNRIQNAYAQQQNQQLASLLQALQGGASSEADYEAGQKADWLTRQGSIAQRLGLSDWTPV